VVCCVSSDLCCSQLTPVSWSCYSLPDSRRAIDGDDTCSTYSYTGEPGR
jgi:hypothetical protein